MRAWQDRWGVPATALAAVLWGTSFPANQVGVDHMPPEAFVAWRFTVAALLVLLVAGRLVARALRRREAWLLGALNAGAFVLQYMGQTTAPAGASGLLVNANVVVVALVAWVVLAERPTTRVWGALALALAGAGLVAYEPGGGLRLGHTLVFLSGALFSVYMVASRWALLRGMTPAEVGSSTFVVTAILLSPLLLLRAPPPDATSWSLVVYTALACTVAAYGLWLLGLKKVGATASAVILLLEIFVAAALGALLLDETFPPRKLVGGLAIIGAVFLLSWRARSATPAPRAS